MCIWRISCTLLMGEFEFKKIMLITFGLSYCSSRSPGGPLNPNPRKCIIILDEYR